MVWRFLGDNFAGICDAGVLWLSGEGKFLLGLIQGYCGLPVWWMCYGRSDVCVCI